MLKTIGNLTRTGLWLAVFVVCGQASAAPALDPKGVEFFEAKIRPLLAESCYECHSAKGKVKGGLLLDTREAVLKGGDTGPALVPGSPDKSLIIRAVRYGDENLQMPPKGKKLSPQQITDLEEWVKMGAPDPRESGGKPVDPFDVIKQQTRNHWAFKPVQPQEVPKVKNQRWVQTPVDNFILAKLESKKLQPSPPADKRTLIRRVTFDLLGMPPKPEEVDAFLADKSTNAYEKLIERLMASPHYGERWARHWLDVARYADTKGYLAGDAQRRYPYSYTYRDYVIRAFNEDLPFDRFVKEQIAADLLPLGEDKRALAGLGFITLGRRFLGNPHDIIDDRIDVVTRGFMGLTVVCARCHDHKYDPIPTKDYYSFYGIFNSTTEPDELPLLGVIPDQKLHEGYLAEKKRREEVLVSFRQSKVVEALVEARKRAGDYMLAWHETKSMNDTDATKSIQSRKLDPDVARRWKNSMGEWSKNANHPVLGPWFALSALKDEEFAAKAKDLIEKSSANALVKKTLVEPPAASMKEVAERYGKLLQDVDKQWADLVAAEEKKGAKVTALPDPDREVLRLVLYAEGAPSNVPPNEQDGLLEGARPRLRQLKAEVDEVDAVHPGAPPRAMAIRDTDRPRNPHVFVRGNPGNRGPEVPRQFLEILAGEKRQPFKNGSGRLELAEAIAARDNPLTSRVLVNRVWLEHMGSGLVRTPSDFGVRSDPPTHPELLDYLAARFVNEGWSIKKLHRWILLSATYQQSSDPAAKQAQQSAAIDPNNELLWKMNRRRLDFEAMRDTFLTISGKIDLHAGGLPVELTQEPFTGRRSVYGYIDRQNLPGMFRAFDFANPDTTSAQRFNTTVPQQALFLMNSSFMLEQARHFIQRPDVAAETSDDGKIRRLYRLAYQRNPDTEELNSAKRFIAGQAKIESPKEDEATGWQYGYGKFDSTSGRVAEFKAFGHLVGKTWQGGPALPDPELGYLLLTAEGGHPGNNLGRSAIRRWIAPDDGNVSIDATISHPNDKGDGVEGRIVSSLQGQLKSGVAANGKAEMKLTGVKIKKGEVIDFVAECRTESSFDSFSWAPKIRYGAASGSEQRVWDARRDFSKPQTEAVKPLDAWEKLAQVLLLSNEVVFAD